MRLPRAPPHHLFTLCGPNYLHDLRMTFFFSCGAGLGMALWILESYVVLLDVTDVHNVKGCTVTPPYLDEYGETDPGLRWVWLGMPGQALHATYDVIITSLQYHNMTLSCNV